MASAAPLAVRLVLDRWHRAEAWLAAGAIAFIVLLLLADVVGRELLGMALRWAGAPYVGLPGAAKIAVLALIVATFAGLGVVAGGGTHLRPRLGWTGLPRAWDAALDRIADAVTAAGLGAAAACSAVMVGESRALGLLVPTLQWPVWPFQLALPLGFGSAALRHVCFAVWPQLAPRRRAAAP